MIFKTAVSSLQVPLPNSYLVLTSSHIRWDERVFKTAVSSLKYLLRTLNVYLRRLIVLWWGKSNYKTAATFTLGLKWISMLQSRFSAFKIYTK